MVSYKLLVCLLAIVPTIVYAVIYWIDPTILSGKLAFDRSIGLSWLGVSLSYYGLIFSSYAALQVQALSDTYFFKNRSPDLKKKLLHISKSVSDFSSEPSRDLRSQSFISEASVAFRSAKRIKNKHVKKVAEQGEKSLDKLKDSMISSSLPNKSAGEVANFWEFHQKITELIDELIEQVKDARAHS